MSSQPGDEKQVSSPKLLSQPWLIALILAFCVFVRAAGAGAEEIGGGLGVAIWFVAWGIMASIVEENGWHVE